MVLPNLLQGLYRRRRRAVRLATNVDVDGRAVRFLSGLRRRLGSGPTWIRIGRNDVLFVQEPADIRRVLGGSPEPFAPDPPTKRQGMVHFQPDAVTISRGERWHDRHAFNAAVLDEARGPHRLAERFRVVVAEEIEALTGVLDWPSFHACFGRIARRIIFGDGGREDKETSRLLAKLMDEANAFPKDRSEDLDRLMGRIHDHVVRAEEGSLVSLFRDAPSGPETRMDGQVPHWMFATHETLGANVFRALALIVSHPAHLSKVRKDLAGGGSLSYLEACLQDAMRLYPTTPMLSREAASSIEWDGHIVPAGTVVLISNTFNHRDRERHEFADRFSPEVWLDSGRADDWSFNHFSHGPQACTGGGLAILIGTTALAALLSDHKVRLIWPDLDPQRPLPHMLDSFRIRFELGREN